MSNKKEFISLCKTEQNERKATSTFRAKRQTSEENRKMFKTAMNFKVMKNKMKLKNNGFSRKRNEQNLFPFNLDKDQYLKTEMLRLR